MDRVYVAVGGSQETVRGNLGGFSVLRAANIAQQK